jgi:SMODS-associated and fused to various effectors sensor domain/TIR domain
VSNAVVPQPARDPNVGRRPVSAFLSHWRGNAPEIAALQLELRLRGVHVWRDVDSLEFGQPFEPAIRSAVADDVSAFVAYVTPDFLARPIIWDVEVPAALARLHRDPDFLIIPLFCGVSPAALTARCAELSLLDLSRFNGVELAPRGSRAKRAAALKTVARRTLRAGLHQRLTADAAYVPRLLLRAQEHTPDEPGVDLDLDWAAPFADGCPAPAVWQHDLLPALRDIRDTLSALSRRRLHVQVQARLSAPIALGEVFSATAKYTLTFSGANGAWSTDATRRAVPVLAQTAIAAPGRDRTTALVEVSISRAVGRSVGAHATGLGADAPGRAVRLEPVAGAGQRSVEDADWALSAAWEVGECLRALHDTHGIRHIHLYVAAPAEWCVLLGHTLNAVGRITVHQWHPTLGDYVRACTLGATGIVTK